MSQAGFETVYMKPEDTTDNIGESAWLSVEVTFVAAFSKSKKA